MHPDLFVDRAPALSELRAFVADEDRLLPTCCFYDVRPASGFTAFLRHFRDLHVSGSNHLLFYLDGANEVGNTLFSQLLWGLRAMHPDLYSDFISSTQRRLGRPRTGRLLQAALRSIPYAGPVVDEAIALRAETMALDLSNYPSAVAELLCDYLFTLSRERRVVLLIDNAQSVDPWSLDLIRTTAGRSYANVRYVAGNVARPAKHTRREELRLRFESTGYDIHERSYPLPDVPLAQELSNALGRPIDRTNAEECLRRSQGDIYRLIATIRRYARIGSIDDASEADEPRPPLESEVIGLLLASRQGLRQSDLLTLCTQTPTVFVQHLDEFGAAIDALEAGGFITRATVPGGDVIVTLTAFGSPAVRAAAADTAKMAVLASRLYRFFAEAMLHPVGRHSPAEVAPLLYRLARTVAPHDRPQRARAVLALSLCAGSLNAAQAFVAHATNPHGGPLTSHDYMLLVVFNIAVRDYDQALRLLDQSVGTGASGHRYFEVLRAICLNRVRRHAEAEALIDRLLSSASVEERVLLTSFRISGRLHDNDVPGAREIFRCAMTELASAPNVGYLMRNGAAAFRKDEALPLLDEALRRLDPETDPFGHFSTLSNRGARKCEAGRPEEALEDLTRACTRLEVYGVNHLHIVENNIGICLCLLGRLDAAAQHLRRSLLFSHSTMPSVYATLNLALVLTLQDKHDEAQAALRPWERAVAEASFDRMRQKFYINWALLAAFSSRGASEVARLATLAARHPDRDDPKLTERALAILIRDEAARHVFDAPRLIELFSPCYLEYWYQSPLELLTEDALASSTAGNDMTY